MLAPRVRQATTSTGTGDLTLSATSGWRSFHDVFLTGTFYYYLVHENGAEWEFGVGKMTDSTTFSRGIVVANSDGTEAAIDLTAGEKAVTCAIAGELMGGFDFAEFDDVTISSNPHGWHIESGSPVPRAGGIGPVDWSDRVVYSPLLLTHSSKVNAISIISTDSVNTVVGIYSCTTDGKPGVRLGKSDVISFTGSTVAYSAPLSSSVSLPAGWYYLAITQESACNMLALGGNESLIHMTGEYSGWIESRAYDGDLPATAGTVSANDYGPLLHLRTG